MPKIKTHKPGATSEHLADPHKRVGGGTAPHAGFSRQDGGKFRQGSSHMSQGGHSEHGEQCAGKKDDDGDGWL